MTDDVVEFVDLPSLRFVILVDSGAGRVFAAQRILLPQKTYEGAEAIAGRFEAAGSPFSTLSLVKLRVLHLHIYIYRGCLLPSGLRTVSSKIVYRSL